MAKYRTREIVVDARQIEDGGYEEVEIAGPGTYCASEGDWVINWADKTYVLPDAVFQSLFAPVDEHAQPNLDIVLELTH